MSTRAEQITWLRLSRTENVGPVTFRTLLERFGSAETALDALPSLAKRGGKGNLIPFPIGKAKAELERLEDFGGQLLLLSDPNYPPLLKTIHDPPPVLAMLGHAQLLRQPCVAIVGARNASANGRQMARKLAMDLAAEGYTVASGLARGIDAAAHEGALQDGTAAVCAGGVDVPYPPENTQLYQRIGNAGLLLAEQPLGTQPQARHFPRRNRIVSGMAQGVVVVEATAKSGSLITARLALEQGREVMAVPGSPLDPRAQGPNGLLRQGAALIETASDVIAALRDRSQPIFEEPERGFTGPPPAPAEVSDDARQAVLAALGPTPIAVDELIRECQVSPASMAVILLELDLAGRLERHPGNRVSRLG